MNLSTLILSLMLAILVGIYIFMLTSCSNPDNGFDTWAIQKPIECGYHRLDSEMYVTYAKYSGNMILDMYFRCFPEHEKHCKTVAKHYWMAEGLHPFPYRDLMIALGYVDWHQHSNGKFYKQYYETPLDSLKGENGG